jgi:HEAT repeat protein
MLTTIALLAAALLPQTPPDDTAGTLRHASLLPPETLVAIEVAPTASFRAELEQTKLWSTLQESLDQPALRDVLAALSNPFLGQFGDGVRPSDLLSNGGTVAIVRYGSGQDPKYGVVAILEAGTQASRLTNSLDERSTDPKAGVVKRDRGAARGWLIDTPYARVALALAGTTMVVGTPADTADVVLDRRSGRDTTALAGSPGYRDFCDHVGSRASADRIVTVYCDFGNAIDQAVARLPFPTRDPLTRWFTNLGVDRIRAAGLLLEVGGGMVRERLVVGLPSPRPPMLEALFPSKGHIALDTATLAPRDIAAFSAVHLDVRGLYLSLLSTLDDVEPDAAASVRGVVQTVGKQLGVDLESDVIFALGQRIVSMAWPNNNPSSSGDWVYVLDLERRDRLGDALARLPGFDHGKIGGHDLIVQRSGGVSFAVSTGSFVIADSERTLRRWLGDQRAPTPHPEVRATLVQLSEGGIGCGWMNLRPLMSDALRTLDQAGPMLGDAAALRGVVSRAATHLSPLSWRLYSNSQGVTVQFDSGSGFLSEIALATLGVGAEEALNDPAMAQLLSATKSSADARAVRIAQVLAALQIGETRYFERHKTYCDIDSLLENGLVDRDLFEGRRPDGVHAVGDMLVSALLTTEGEPHWMAVVWPMDRRTGDVFAVGDLHGPMRNELVARTRGMSLPMLRDVFLRGDANAGLTPGWRALDLGADSMEVPLAVAGTGEAATLGILTALEKRGEAAVDDILKYLDSDSPRVVARAIFALGKLRASKSVPRLIEVALQSTSIEVQQQAMRALLLFGDRRTIQASMELLASKDATVRKIAATNLGRLKASEARDVLNALAAKTDASRADDEDSAAALLALGEIGDPAVLLLASSSCKSPGKRSEEALVWLFQTLSPKLEGEGEETKALIAVLDHESTLLRRYAVQRLGDLRDPNAASALEGRLAQENDQLRPLVEVALASIRGGMGEAEKTGLAGVAQQIGAAVQRLWSDRRIRGLIIAVGSFLAVVAIGLTMVFRRQRKRRKGENWAARAREVAGPAPTAPVRLRPRYEDYQPEYQPGENWDAEIASGEEDEWPMEEEWSEAGESETQNAPRRR